MCGITGITLFSENDSRFLDKIKPSIQTLSKRGPDYQATFAHKQTALGHARLSIIDTTESANQPFTDETNRYTLVYNGEIFNFKELKQELKKLGLTFKTESDTEVLLYAYIKWGKDCLSKLNGFFSFCIHDKEVDSLFIARDRFGIKPLLYYSDENKFIFGSEMKAILEFGIEKQINQVALSTYFQLNYTPAPLTMIKGVQKLEPGHSIEIKNKAYTIEQWYKLEFHEFGSSKIRYEDAKTKLIELLSKSVEKRLVADVPVGTFLSGGIDSSVITALASEHKKDLQTFSIGYTDNPFFDETHYAELVAKKYNTHHTTFKLSNNDLLEDIDGFFNYIDEPFADSSAIAVNILTKRTRQKVTVALSGDGADEIFSGYNKHTAEYKTRNSRSLNTLVNLLSPFIPFLPKSRNTKFGNIFRQLDKYLTGLRLSPQERYWVWASLMSKKELKNLLIYPADTSEIEKKYSSIIRKSESLNDILYADTHLVLPNDMLTKVDLMSMKNSLEVRTPFLDHSVVEFAFSLPSAYKIDKHQKKIILQNAFRKYLPTELYNRPKHGFEVPLTQWFKKELAQTINDNLLDKDFIEYQNIFNYKFLDEIVKKLHSNNPEDSHANIWAILVFQKWYKNYFNA